MHVKALHESVQKPLYSGPKKCRAHMSLSLPGSNKLFASKHKQDVKMATTLSTTSLHRHSIRVFLVLGPVKKLLRFSNSHIVSSIICPHPWWISPFTCCPLKTGENCGGSVVVVYSTVDDVE